MLVLQVGHVNLYRNDELRAEVCEFCGFFCLPRCNLGVVGLLVLCQLGLVFLAAFRVFGFDFGILGSVGGFDIFQLFLQLCEPCHFRVILCPLHLEAVSDEGCEFVGLDSFGGCLFAPFGFAAADNLTRLARCRRRADCAFATLGLGCGGCVGTLVVHIRRVQVIIAFHDHRHIFLGYRDSLQRGDSALQTLHIGGHVWQQHQLR